MKGLNINAIFIKPREPNQNFLGVPATVQKIIRRMLGQVTIFRSEQLQGQPVDIVRGIDKLCRLIQDIFYGKRPEFRPTPLHRADSLGMILVTRCNMGGDQEDAVYRLATRMFLEFTKAFPQVRE